MALAELGNDYWLDVSALSDYIGIEENDAGIFNSQKTFNYFSLTVFLFYMKNKVRYFDLKKFIESKIQEKFDCNKKTIWNDAELILLLMDSLTCPYVSTDLKERLLNIYGITDKELQKEVINKRQQWFTSWKSFDFRKELDAKRSKEVY